MLEKRRERTEGREGTWACRVGEAAWGDWILFSRLEVREAEVGDQFHLLDSYELLRVCHMLGGVGAMKVRDMASA